MTFDEFTEFVACAAFATLLWAPSSVHALVIGAEIALIAGLFIGRRYGKADRHG